VIISDVTHQLLPFDKFYSQRVNNFEETRGFLKALVGADGNRILGFAGFGFGAAEILSSVLIAMIAGLPYTIQRDALLTHPTLVEGVIPLFSSVPSLSKSAAAKS
jgi:pyruvate/2-oxoglutarate dehydrogenase complex dihydrolipoamide dehydrogenase (E3) component